jgi:His/Glu/Gln/Arg/opine family amino acid ABC transporter permease subunit
LLLANFLQGAIAWAVTNAIFDPARTTPEFRSPDGATWGVIWGARKLLMTGRLPPEYNGRVFTALFLILGMWTATYVTGRPSLRARLKPARRVLNVLWILLPFALYILLAGLSPPEPLADVAVTVLAVELVVMAIYGVLVLGKVVQFKYTELVVWAFAWPVGYFIWRGIAASGIYPDINEDQWGGLMYTLILAVSVNLLSFPLGIGLALGRRSKFTGIPRWIVWPVAIFVTLYLLMTMSPDLIANARNNIEWLLSFWPLLIIGVAYLFDQRFDGNVVATSSTLFIEFVRGVPLITLLFMAIIMAKFFFEDVSLLKNAYAAIVGFTLFSAAYMAETIRGGLQAIPKGQYEAADAIGLNTLQKYRFIIMPQALRIVIPALVGQFIGTFKASSLVAIVGLFDLTGIVNAIMSNPNWLGLRRELYVFIALVYFLGSSLMSWYSRRLEVRLGLGER